MFIAIYLYSDYGRYDTGISLDYAVEWVAANGISAATDRLGELVDPNSKVRIAFRQKLVLVFLQQQSCLDKTTSDTVVPETKDLST